MSAPCPICAKAASAAHRPFCSARCRTVDLNRWFTGGYAMPAVELDDLDAQALEEALENRENRGDS